MQVNFDTSSNNTNFKALYLHKGFKHGKTYAHHSAIANFVKSDIENIAQDVDIHIKFRNIMANRGFDIFVGDVVKSPLKRVLGMIGLTTHRFFCPEDFLQHDVTGLFLDNIKRTKEEYVNIVQKENV